MNRHSVSDMDLIAARPDDSTVDHRFTDSVMERIEPRHEIISSVVRKTDITHKKETWYMRFKHLSFATTLAIIVAIIVGAGGVAYAAYRLWPKPEAKTSGYHLNVNNRTELTVTLKNCDSQGASTMTYEVKKDATITKAQIPGIIQAHCELSAIESWAQQTAPAGYGGEEPATKMVNISTAHTVKAVKGHKIILAANTKDGDKYSTTIAVSPDTKLVAGGNNAAMGEIQPGDVVVYATDDLYSKDGGWPIKRHVQLIVKLGLSLSAYSYGAYNSLTEIVPCIGNPKDECKTGAAGGIDIYNNSNNYGSIHDTRQLDGKIITLSPQTITLKGSSGQTFTIDTTSDIIGQFNATKLSTYGISKIAVGDTLTVRYHASDALNATRHISQSQLTILALYLEQSNTKASVPTKY